MPLGALVIWHIPPGRTGREPGFLLKAPVRKTTWRESRIGYGRMELHRMIPEGPIIRFLVEVFDKGPYADPLRFDCFLNPADEDAREMLRAMTEMGTMMFYGYGEHNQPLGVKICRWHPQHQQGAKELLDSTQGIPVLWPQAVERFREENPNV